MATFSPATPSTTVRNRTVADIVENETALAESLQKIRALRIINVFPGHGKPFPMAELTF